MSFYQEIANYYHYLFPANSNQINFIKDTINTPPKDVLDIACGAGLYSVELAKLGYSLTAVDLDVKMVEKAKINAIKNDLNINVVLANMLSLDKLEYKFDTAFCIGNSITHLSNIEEISKFLVNVYNLLKSNGNIVFQIINYDRILNKRITNLPTINNTSINLTFNRNYEYNNGKILFNTILKVDDKEYVNSIPLYPISSSEFLSLLEIVGFNNINTYGNFLYRKYDKDNSYHLVIKAYK